MLCLICSCSTDDAEQNQFVFDASYDFIVRDNDGNDLLNPENPNAYKESDIKLFYKINGNVEEVFEGNLDNPRHFEIFKHKNEYRITVGVNHAKNEDLPITYIQWNEADTDTIKAKFRRTDNLTIIKKLWLNGKQIFPPLDDGSGEFYTIIK